eukprot:9449907-Pyramimonas_sp.AAC.2
MMWILRAMLWILRAMWWILRAMRWILRAMRWILRAMWWIPRARTATETSLVIIGTDTGGIRNYLGGKLNSPVVEWLIGA